MTDLEINKRLALAIGWGRGDIIEYKWAPFLQVWWQDGWEAEWRTFDYRDWNVIGPIAERYDAFPMRTTDKVIRDSKWFTFDIETGVSSAADTPQKAIAMAVIQGVKHDR